VLAREHDDGRISTPGVRMSMSRNMRLPEPGVIKARGDGPACPSNVDVAVRG
jgi:hypothetical protein